jgi:enolase
VKRTAIERVFGRRVWDSRGLPTVEAEIHLAGGATGRAIAPAGASKGSGEARERRDGGKHLGGLDVGSAVAAIRDEIGPHLRGRNAADQDGIDSALIALDGTPDKGRLGANAIVAVSMAIAHAAAAAARLPLWRYLAGDGNRTMPLPEIQIFGGGAHAGRRVDIQDFMVVAVGADNYAQALEWTAEVYRSAGALMDEAGLRHGVADEGGYWPAFASNEAALDMLLRAIERAGYRAGDEIALSLDIAASDFGRGARYRLGRDSSEIDSDGLIELLQGWLRRFPIVAIEDPLAEDDAAAFARFTAGASGIAVIGDDLLVTNKARIEAAAAARTCNAALIKPNQVGTLTEAKAAFEAARHAGWTTIVSARSGDNEDVTIMHLAVGWGADLVKVGSFARSERMAKWNEGLRIAEALPGGSRLTSANGFPWSH